MLNSYESEILEYISSIGIRTKNTKANTEVYGDLIKITCELFKYEDIKNIFYDYLSLIDCIAQNILGVQIYAGEYEVEPRREEFKHIYCKLREIHNKYSM